eukprot:GFUD01031352.1.p1 GENE.GFUD01031352.1~~GFUD01031352.1.p1  ORF type:complete len:468 (+),score=76.63 GFUD01031352.1:210-1613(+)
MEEEATEDKPRYRTYRRRWLVLITVTLLNLSNNALWISYSAVANVATEYFEQNVNKIDLLATISFYVGIPMCLVSTFVVDALGFRTGMLLGTSLTFLGALVRCLSTFPGLTDSMDLNLQFILSVVGQALTGMGNPIAVSVPTKVSQNWFPESERLLATGILAMSLPLGIVLGQGCSPLFVKTGEDVPLMNIVWLIPATITMVFCIAFIRTSNPPSPPSKSAELAGQQERKSFSEYLANMKSVFTNGPFMVLFTVIGGAVGFFNAFSTQLSQLMCARGYDNAFSGLCGSLLLGTGFIGAIATGTLVEKYGKMEEISKLFYGIAGISGILIAEFMRTSDSGVYIALFCSMFGVFGFGMYPLGLELSVEATYPVDESIGTALIFMSGQIQGGILVFASQMLEQDLKGDDLLKEVCSTASSSTTSLDVGKDHTNFLLVIAGYLCAMCLIFITFFSTKLKRTLANQNDKNSE